MNKLWKSCLFGVIASMAIGLSAVALGSKQNLAEAEAITGQMHFYKRISSTSELNYGDKIVLSTIYGRTFDASCGNPRFYRMNDVSGYNNSLTKIYADESQIKRFEIGPGATEGSYSFKCIDHDTYGDVYGLYLYFTEDRNAVQPHDRGDVGYYMTNMCFKEYKNGVNEGHASWEITPTTYWGETNDYFCITRADEPRKQDGYRLCYGGSSARPALSYGATDEPMYIFKEIPFNRDVLKDINPVTVTNDPDRSQYYAGDQVDLAGLEVNIYYKDEYAMTLSASYNDEPSFFNVTSAAQQTGNVIVEYCGVTFSVPIEVIEKPVNSSNYNLVKSALHDYRGTYVIGCYDEDYFYGLKTRLIDETPSSKSVTLTAPLSRLNGSVVNIPNSKVEETDIGNVDYPSLPCTIERKTINQHSYHFINCYGGYLSYSTDEEHVGELIVKSAQELTANDAVTINADSSLSMNGRTLTTDAAFVFGPGYLTAHLYKLMPDTDYQTHIDNFVTTFVNGTAEACAALEMTETIWNNMSTAFASLTLDEQAYFVNLEYLHELEDINSAENVADRYDYIVAKYGFSDFMDRKDAGTWKDYVHADDSRLPDDDPSLSRLIGTEVNASIVIVALTITAILSISSVLFFINRRKHQ